MTDDPFHAISKDTVDKVFACLSEILPAEHLDKGPFMPGGHPIVTYAAPWWTPGVSINFYNEWTDGDYTEFWNVYRNGPDDMHRDTIGCPDGSYDSDTLDVLSPTMHPRLDADPMTVAKWIVSVIEADHAEMASL